MSVQLSLLDPLCFDGGSNLPVPLRAAEHFGFPLQYHGEMYALQDWVRGLTGEHNGNELKGMMRRLKAEVSFKNTSEKMPYKASDGKTYKRDFVDSRGLYQAVAYLRAKKDRPILKELKDFLADAGVFIEEVAKNPGKAAQRIEEIADRKIFTASARKSHVTHTPDYAKLTNTAYEILFGAAKCELVKQLGLDYKQAKRFRDHISDLARRAIQSAEAGAAAQFGNLYDLTTAQQIEIVCKHARTFAPAFAQSAEMAGIDLLSGEKLLGPIDAIRGLGAVID